MHLMPDTDLSNPARANFRFIRWNERYSYTIPDLIIRRQVVEHRKREYTRIILLDGRSTASAAHAVSRKVSSTLKILHTVQWPGSIREIYRSYSVPPIPQRQHRCFKPSFHEGLKIRRSLRRAPETMEIGIRGLRTRAPWNFARCIWNVRGKARMYRGPYSYGIIRNTRDEWIFIVASSRRFATSTNIISPWCWRTFVRLTEYLARKNYLSEQFETPRILSIHQHWTGQTRGIYSYVRTSFSYKHQQRLHIHHNFETSKAFLLLSEIPCTSLDTTASQIGLAPKHMLLARIAL